MKHIPFKYDLKNSNTKIIFIHGILEGPSQFERMANIANTKGYSTTAILLPGHGSSGEDFAKSSLFKWKNCLRDEITKSIKEYKNIVLVGHSMGCLLSISIYEEFSKYIKAIISIATPLSVYVHPRLIKSSIKIQLSIIRDEDILTSSAYNAFSVSKSSIYTYFTWVPRYMDLFRLMREPRKKIDYIDKPMLLIHSMNDELVRGKTLKIIKYKFKDKVDKKIISLSNSGHFYYDDNDLNFLEREFEEFIDSLKLERSRI